MVLCMGLVITKIRALLIVKAQTTGGDVPVRLATGHRYLYIPGTISASTAAAVVVRRSKITSMKLCAVLRNCLALYKKYCFAAVPNKRVPLQRHFKEVVMQRNAVHVRAGSARTIQPRTQLFGPRSERSCSDDARNAHTELATWSYLINTSDPECKA